MWPRPALWSGTLWTRKGQDLGHGESSTCATPPSLGDTWRQRSISCGVGWQARTMAMDRTSILAIQKQTPPCTPCCYGRSQVQWASAQSAVRTGVVLHPITFVPQYLPISDDTADLFPKYGDVDGCQPPEGEHHRIRTRVDKLIFFLTEREAYNMRWHIPRNVFYICFFFFSMNYLRPFYLWSRHHIGQIMSFKYEINK